MRLRLIGWLVVAAFQILIDPSSSMGLESFLRSYLRFDVLMYHYFTTLRSNQIPASNADLLKHRGQIDYGDIDGTGTGEKTPWNYDVSSIPDVPEGTYLVKASHPDYGYQERSVSVPASGTASVNFAF